MALVGVAGFEPAASRSQTERSTKLSYTPKRTRTRSVTGSVVSSVGLAVRSWPLYAVRRSACQLAAGEGIEPSFPESKSGVLPLNEPAVGWVGRSRTCDLRVNSSALLPTELLPKIT